MSAPCMVSHDGGKTWVAFKPKPRPSRYQLRRDPTTGERYVVKVAGKL